jgi:hypothetical protein
MDSTFEVLKTKLTADELIEYCEKQIIRINSVLIDRQEELLEFKRKVLYSKNRDIIKQCVDSCKDDIESLLREGFIYACCLEDMEK